MDHSANHIQLKNVRTNNLRGLDVAFPIGKISVVTGVSGSGKSSLVFDTLYGESYRRYVESLSSFARQYMKSLPKPEIDSVTNLPPAIAVKQVKSQSNSRSTVGTATELYDLIRILYTHLGKTFCPKCGKPVEIFHAQSIAHWISMNHADATVMILANLEKYRAYKSVDLKAQLLTFGFVRALLKGKIARIESLSEEEVLNSSVIIDRVQVEAENDTRILEAIKTAMQLSKGKVQVCDESLTLKDFPTTRTCCHKDFKNPSPALFSFNHPLGACTVCQGFGAESVIDWEKVFPDLESSLKGHGVVPWNFGSHDDMYKWASKSAKKSGIDIGKPFKDYTAADWKWLKSGSSVDDFTGIEGYFEWLLSKKHKAHLRIHAARFRKYVTCSGCHGYRLNEDALHVKVAQRHIGEFCDLRLSELTQEFTRISHDSHNDLMVLGISEIIEEALIRTNYLIEVGLGYLSLNRQTRTLSGGEFQRINMARCLGSALTDTLYCLDEPTSGLHARDGERLMSVIKNLRDQGNTVVVVEHEKVVIQQADYVVEVGPGAGHLGGEVTYSGKPMAFKAEKQKSLPKAVSKAKSKVPDITLKGVTTHNLQNVDVTLPLSQLTVVCGVSGSGKTSLIQHSLYPELAHALGQKKLDGFISETQVRSFAPRNIQNYLSQVVHVSQTTLGRSSRSTIATYLGVMNEIRKIFAEEPVAKSLRLNAGHFSFNTKGGRCETCVGLGTVTEDLSFLGEMNVRCPDCNGNRFTEKVLKVKYRDHNLIDVLSLTVQQARELFFDHKKLVKILDSIIDLGLGYVTLGQNSSSFSGGEGQRLKLLRLLQDAIASQKPSFLIFDEPSTGLSDQDVAKLIEQFRFLIELGHTVLVVEHHLDIIKAADWLIEVGPDAADQGGKIVYSGPVSGLKNIKESQTARYIDWESYE